MPSFGEKLKRERDRQGITLQQISVSTKIGTRMLQAIEEEHFNQLPGGIFNRGFVRAYARFLGLDEEETLAEYVKVSGTGIPAVPMGDALHQAVTIDASAQRGTQADRGNEIISGDGQRHLQVEAEAEGATLERQLPWGIFAALLLLTALTLSLWNRFERTHSSQTFSAGPVTGGPGTGGAVTGDAVAGSPSKFREADNPAAPARQGVAPSPAAYVQTSGQASLQKSGVAAIAPGVKEFSLLIQARQESWITITADGRQVVSELMTAGSERTVRGRQQVTVKAGNSGGMDFQLNGKKLESAGELGRVKTITFGPGGIL